MLGDIAGVWRGQLHSRHYTAAGVRAAPAMPAFREPAASDLPRVHAGTDPSLFFMDGWSHPVKGADRPTPPPPSPSLLLITAVQFQHRHPCHCLQYFCLASTALEPCSHQMVLP